MRDIVTWWRLVLLMKIKRNKGNNEITSPGMVASNKSQVVTDECSFYLEEIKYKNKVNKGKRRVSRNDQ